MANGKDHGRARRGGRDGRNLFLLQPFLLQLFLFQPFLLRLLVGLLFLFCRIVVVVVPEERGRSSGGGSLCDNGMVGKVRRRVCTSVGG
jgi:hypothetical protein